MNLRDKIIESEEFKEERRYYQHGSTTVYEHSLNVLNMCLKIVQIFNIKVDMDSLIKGALLHDFFLYDWHLKDDTHKLHAISHPITALKNAKKYYQINKKEENMILSHMFPLALTLPRYKESWILTIADKYCALKETLEPVILKYSLITKL